MMIGSAFVFCLGLTLAYGTPCVNLTGIWRNELGSNMSIVHLPEDSNKFTGQYNTSVESSKGAARLSSAIAGLMTPVDGGSLIAFNVLYNKGASLTAWVGQCIVCDGKEKIFTSWVLRSLRPPIKKWLTTVVNQDTFWRLEGVEQTPLERGNVDSSANSNILGTWNSVSGDTLDITFAAKAGSIDGEHLSTEQGNAPATGIFGSTDGNTTYTALGFSAAEPAKIRGWSGHIYNPEGPNAVLETSWLAHAFSDNCNNPRRLVSFGMDNYTQPI